MRRTHRLAAVAIALGLVLAVGVPAAAVAAPPPGFDPSSTKWRAFQVNILGSVLGKFTPSKFRAEQIANQFALKHYSPDALAAATGIGRGSPLDRIPETIEDYYAQEYDRQVKRGVVAKQSGSKILGLKVPSSPAKAFVRTLGGVGTVVVALEAGTALGSVASDVTSGWMGFNAQDVVCAQVAGDSVAGGLTEWVTGRNCDGWSFGEDYIANKDQPVQYGALQAGSYTGTFNGVYRPNQWPNPNWFEAACFTHAGALPANYQIGYRTATGGWQETGTGASPFTASGSAYCTVPTGQRVHYGSDGAGNHHTGSASLKNPGWPALELRYLPPGGTAAYTTMPETSADPNRRLDCKVTYSDGSSATVAGAIYKETEGAVKPPECPATPAGKVPTDVAVTENFPGSATSPNTLYDEETTPESQRQHADFPECADGTCLLDLVKVIPGSGVVSCFDLADGCPGWFEDPAKADTYKCVYGSEAVALTECNLYAGLFTPQRVEIGSPYNDPTTGTWSGGQTAPKSGQSAMTATIQNPEELRSCDFSGLGFDPVGWVLKPIQCAFEWATIPRPSVVELHNAQLKSKWDGSMPGQYATAVSGVGTAFAGLGAGNCNGIPVDVPVPNSDGSIGSQSGSLFNSCPGSPLQPAATGVYWLLTGLAVFLGLLGIRAMLNRFVGF